jgi:hypothetical protein
VKKTNAQMSPSGPGPWHVYRSTTHYRVFSDREVKQMSESERNTYRPVRTGFVTADDANAIMWSLRHR